MRIKILALSVSIITALILLWCLSVSVQMSAAGLSHNKSTKASEAAHTNSLHNDHMLEVNISSSTVIEKLETTTTPPLPPSTLITTTSVTTTITTTAQEHKKARPPWIQYIVITGKLHHKDRIIWCMKTWFPEVIKKQGPGSIFIASDESDNDLLREIGLNITQVVAEGGYANSQKKWPLSLQYLVDHNMTNSEWYLILDDDTMPFHDNLIHELSRIIEVEKGNQPVLYSQLAGDGRCGSLFYCGGSGHLLNRPMVARVAEAFKPCGACTHLLNIHPTCAGHVISPDSQQALDHNRDVFQYSDVAMGSCIKQQLNLDIKGTSTFHSSFSSENEMQTLSCPSTIHLGAKTEERFQLFYQLYSTGDRKC